MGRSVDLNKYDYFELKMELIKEFGIDNSDGMLDKILLSFGEIPSDSDTYFLLNNEFWEDDNSYYGCPTLIDKYYKVDGSFNVFCKLGKESKVASMNWYDVADKLGIYDEISEYEEEEE